MQNKLLIASVLAATAMLKPQVDDDTGLVSYKNAETGQTEQINRDQVKSMGELDN
ncbi:MAG: YgdI/YgdR family lipoprotein [Enterobacter sp.]|nr:YgdI/YgdR family lipoprotein [Enterobacter sp.]